MYHFSPDKYVPLQSRKVCTTSVQKSVPFQSRQVCTTSVQTRMYLFGPYKSLQSLKVCATSVQTNMYHFSPDKYAPFGPGKYVSLQSRKYVPLQSRKVCTTSVQRWVPNLYPSVSSSFRGFPVLANIYIYIYVTVRLSFPYFFLRGEWGEKL